MIKRSTIINTTIYVSLGLVTIDTLKRAITGQGLIELVNFDVTPILESLGMVKQKTATELAQLYSTTQELTSTSLERILEAIKNQDVPAVQTAIKELSQTLEPIPKELEDITLSNGYVVDIANNIKWAAGATGLFVIKALYSLYMKGRGKVLKQRSSIIDKKPVKSLDELAGVYIAEKIHPELRFYSNRDYEKYPKKEDVLNSFERSNLRDIIQVKKGLEVHICYLVPGDNNFALEIPGRKQVSKKIIENKFYLGLEDITFNKPGTYEIGLTVGQKKYTAKVNVI